MAARLIAIGIVYRRPDNVLDGSDLFFRYPLWGKLVPFKAHDLRQHPQCIAPIQLFPSARTFIRSIAEQPRKRLIGMVTNPTPKFGVTGDRLKC